MNTTDALAIIAAYEHVVKKTPRMLAMLEVARKVVYNRAEAVYNTMEVHKS